MKFAVLLSGCGFLDGSEIQEVVFCLHSLARQSHEAVCFSIDENQAQVISHVNGDKVNYSRNMLEESSRISRGQIKNLNSFRVSNFDGIIIPGGFGCVLNFSDFATKDHEIKVHREVERVIKECHENKKIIGAICIAPVLVAKVLGFFKPVLTVGDNEGVEGSMKLLGAKTKKCSKGDYVIDPKNMIYSSPAYMYSDSTCVEVANGIEKMISAF